NLIDAQFDPRGEFDRGIVLRGCRSFQLAELLSQQGNFLVIQSTQVLDHLRPDPGAGDMHIMHSVQVLATQPDLERCALLAPGGINETDIRSRLRQHLGGRCQDKRQAENRKPNGWWWHSPRLSPPYNRRGDFSRPVAIEGE